MRDFAYMMVLAGLYTFMVLLMFLAYYVVPAFAPAVFVVVVGLWLASLWPLYRLMRYFWIKHDK